mmetsp:Transcript_24253/g.55234  ORF Transcript_24253/g.55234 Transcript_24253/m.55234 type:complete len:80 (-) Transcript_24253:642-881(-)
MWEVVVIQRELHKGGDECREAELGLVNFCGCKDLCKHFGRLHLGIPKVVIRGCSMWTKEASVRSSVAWSTFSLDGGSNK